MFSTHMHVSLTKLCTAEFEEDSITVCRYSIGHKRLLLSKLNFLYFLLHLPSLSSIGIQMNVTIQGYSAAIAIKFHVDHQHCLISKYHSCLDIGVKSCRKTGFWIACLENCPTKIKLFDEE